MRPNQPPRMNRLTLFLPCAAGAAEFLAHEVHGLTGLVGDDLQTVHGGVRVRADWRTAMLLNWRSRLAQRVLIELGHAPCPDETALYTQTKAIAWEQWFGANQTLRVDVSARGSPFKSLNFATLRVKDAVVDRFREATGGARPSIDTRHPDVRIQAHLDARYATLYIDTSGEPLFKRGWRQQKGEAPLKETLAAALLAASGWWQPATGRVSPLALYDPCCGSGTIVIEAAQIAQGLPAGGQRHFAFERMRPFNATQWQAIRQSDAHATQAPQTIQIHGSDIAPHMVAMARDNAARAQVGGVIALHTADALQNPPPCATPGVLVMNPPYGERMTPEGLPDDSTAPQDDFFESLAAHWKGQYADWTAWILTPESKLPGRLRLKASRRVPLWNGPIECRLLRFELTVRKPKPAPA